MESGLAGLGSRPGMTEIGARSIHPCASRAPVIPTPQALLRAARRRGPRTDQVVNWLLPSPPISLPTESFGLPAISTAIPDVTRADQAVHEFRRQQKGG
jgi:hypothetical protein